MSTYTKKETGDIGEDYTVRFLLNKGYNVLKRNYRKSFGEIDIIAENHEYLIFVEVKTRRSGSLTEPWEAVGVKKQRKIIKTAYAFLAENSIEKFCRFDISEVYVDSLSLSLDKLNYIENAFEQESGYEYF